MVVSNKRRLFHDPRGKKQLYQCGSTTRCQHLVGDRSGALNQYDHRFDFVNALEMTRRYVLSTHTGRETQKMNLTPTIRLLRLIQDLGIKNSADDISWTEIWNYNTRHERSAYGSSTI
jgi:hypothetical protein